MGMMRKTFVALSMLAFGGVASAQDVDGAETEAEPESSSTIAMPINYTQRPLTLRKRTLRVDVAPSDFGLMDSGAILGHSSAVGPGPIGSYGIHVGQRRYHDGGPPEITTSDTYGNLGIGAAYGVVDRLEVGLLLVPVNFESGDAFGNMAFYARGALVAGEDFDLGLQATLSVPTRDNLGVAAGLPMNFRVGGNVRIETGVEGEFFFDLDDDSGGDTINVDVPFALSVGVGKGFVGGRTGATLFDVGGANVASIPVGAIGGVSFDAGPTLIDVKGSFTWTFLADGVWETNVQFWALMLGANVHLGL